MEGVSSLRSGTAWLFSADTTSPSSSRTQHSPSDPQLRKERVNINNLPTDVLLAVGEHLPHRLGLPTGSLTKRLVAIFQTPSSIAVRALKHYKTPVEALVLEGRRCEPESHVIVEALVSLMRHSDSLINSEIVTKRWGRLSPLSTAASKGNQQVVLALLRLGASVNARHGEALLKDAEGGHIDVVKLLLENGAEIHARDDGAIRQAALFGRVDTVRLLLDRGAHPDAVGGFALLWASHQGHVDVISLLLDRGANIHTRDDQALWAAVSMGRADVVQLLLQWGADARSDDRGALSKARGLKRADIARLIHTHRKRVVK
ncbi:hypothetical protein HDU93_000364 [Gonapodya sp. JEL0774]|nr:hypothetical protein HDU93_000364 [Gonapodya sp. JEL0774]